MQIQEAIDKRLTNDIGHLDEKLNHFKVYSIFNHEYKDKIKLFKRIFSYEEQIQILNPNPNGIRKKETEYNEKSK